MSTSRIIGLGKYVPETVLTNADLSRMVDTSDEWIASRTGIHERRIAAEGETCSDLALEASKAALADAGIDARELTHILVATFTADSPIPSAACLLQEKLGLSGLVAMDLAAACSGFLYALETARAIIALHPESKVLVVASEIVSSRTDWTDRSTCVLFGDGAGAAVVTAGDGPGLIQDVLLMSDGALGRLLTVKGGGSGWPYAPGATIRRDFFVEMEGREVYKHAVRNMAEVAGDILARHGLGIADVDVLLPHQANMRIIEAVGKKVGIPREKVYANVGRYGNTSAASVPLALTEAREEGLIAPDTLTLVLTFGGGFTWGASLLRF